MGSIPIGPAISASKYAMTIFPDVESGLAYCREVVSGRLSVNTYARLRCEATLQEIADTADPNSRWEFRPDLAQRFMTFAQLFQNIKGKTGGQLIQLLPWQQGMFTALMGMVERHTTNRKYQLCLLFCPKGSGKTFIQAPMALYLTFAENEPGADGFASSQTIEQSRLLFDVVKEMVTRAPAFQRQFGVEVRAHQIYQPRTASTFKPISSATKSLQGKSVHFACTDEIASASTDETYHALRTAMAKRRSPLYMICSTAGSNTAGIGRQLWTYGVEVLEKKKTDERLYSLIYCADDSDDPWDEKTWIKCNPSWGHAGVEPDQIRSTFQQARNNGALESGAFTFHLNKWVGADESLFSMRQWIACGDTSLRPEQFYNQPAHLSLDLASKVDLAGLCITLPKRNSKGELEYTVFGKAYVNEDAVRTLKNASYPEWSRPGGPLTVTPGNATDFAWIEDDIRDLCKKFNVLSIAYDPWGATQLSQRLLDEGLPMVQYDMNTKNLSEPVKEAIAAIATGRLKHDGNPILQYCVGNIVGHYDARQNVFPRRSHPTAKIDLAIAMIMGVGRCMFDDSAQSISIYDRQGRGFYELGAIEPTEPPTDPDAPQPLPHDIFERGWRSAF